MKKKIILTVFLIIWVVFCIKPEYPDEMLLQHSATLVVFLLLVWDVFKNKISTVSVAFIATFMVFHIIAARWIYSYVPYNEWIKSFFQFDLNSFFGWKRNNFDRIVHFSFGFLLAYPIAEIFGKYLKISFGKAMLVSLLFVAGSSAVYEIFEWGISLALSPQDAENYNGQQGDIWDAQKDMALAIFGSILFSIIYVFNNSISRK